MLTIKGTNDEKSDAYDCNQCMCDCKQELKQKLTEHD